MSSAHDRDDASRGPSGHDALEDLSEYEYNNDTWTEQDDLDMEQLEQLDNEMLASMRGRGFFAVPADGPPASAAAAGPPTAAAAAAASSPPAATTAAATAVAASPAATTAAAAAIAASPAATTAAAAAVAASPAATTAAATAIAVGSSPAATTAAAAAATGGSAATLAASRDAAASVQSAKAVAFELECAARAAEQAQQRAVERARYRTEFDAAQAKHAEAAAAQYERDLRQQRGNAERACALAARGKRLTDMQAAHNDELRTLDVKHADEMLHFQTNPEQLKKSSHWSRDRRASEYDSLKQEHVLIRATRKREQQREADELCRQNGIEVSREDASMPEGDNDTPPPPLVLPLSHLATSRPFITMSHGRTRSPASAGMPRDTRTIGGKPPSAALAALHVPSLLAVAAHVELLAETDLELMTKAAWLHWHPLVQLDPKAAVRAAYKEYANTLGSDESGLRQVQVAQELLRVLTPSQVLCDWFMGNTSIAHTCAMRHGRGQLQPLLLRIHIVLSLPSLEAMSSRVEMLERTVDLLCNAETTRAQMLWVDNITHARSLAALAHYRMIPSLKSKFSVRSAIEALSAPLGALCVIQPMAFVVCHTNLYNMLNCGDLGPLHASGVPVSALLSQLTTPAKLRQMNVESLDEWQRAYVRQDVDPMSERLRSVQQFDQMRIVRQQQREMRPPGQ